MAARSIRTTWSVWKDALTGFFNDKVPKLGGSLAYFTIFSIGPMLLVIIYLAGIFLGRQAVEGSLYTQSEQLLGADAARQLQQIIKSASTSQGGVTAAIIGLVTLFIGATSVFAEIQDSINTIWHLKRSSSQGWLQLLLTRLLSFGLVATMGFLLLVSLAASALMEGLGDRLSDLIPGAGVLIFYLISQAFTLLVASFLFAVIFKVLPSAHVSWREVWPGALITALLFMLGRFAISFYISRSDFGSTYGAAGSLVVLLVWVYYSSLILYFGAEYTRAHVARLGAGIRPKKGAYIEVPPRPPGAKDEAAQGIR